MTRQLPAERPLPNKQQVLDRVLATEQPWSAWRQPERRRRGWLVPLVAAASVAAIAAAVLIAPATLKFGDQEAAPAARPTTSELSIDLAPLTQAETEEFAKRCWFWNGTAGTVLHARKVKSGWGDGEEWTIAFEGQSQGGNGVAGGNGRLTACSGRPNKETTGTPADMGFRMENFITQSAPNRYDDSFRPNEGFMLEARPGKKWATSLWIRVPKQVDRVRQRLIVNGEAQQWFSSKAVDGLSYTQAWMDAPIRRSDKFRLEVQFLNSANQLVKIPGSNGPTSVLPSTGLQLNKTYKMSDYLIK